VPFGLFLSFGIFCAIWYILWLFVVSFPRFGMLWQEKSGNPGRVEKNDSGIFKKDK
jgi:hypothetical protein